MLIYSLDRKKIIKARSLSVEKNMTTKKEEKYAIVAENIAGLSAVIAALYPDEKTATDALEKAYQAFAGGAKAYKFD